MSKKTEVVNLYKEPYDVYIGRAGKGQSGYFGNPVKVERLCFMCGETHAKGETLPCFERYARERIANDPEYKREVLNLYGKRLGCFCADPLKCHGSILEKLTEELNLPFTDSCIPFRRTPEEG